MCVCGALKAQDEKERRQNKETRSELSFFFFSDHIDPKRHCHTLSDSQLTVTSPVLNCKGTNSKDRVGTSLQITPEGRVVQMKHILIQK